MKLMQSLVLGKFLPELNVNLIAGLYLETAQECIFKCATHMKNCHSEEC